MRAAIRETIKATTRYFALSVNRLFFFFWFGDGVDGGRDLGISR